MPFLVINTHSNSREFKYTFSFKKCFFLFEYFVCWKKIIFPFVWIHLFLLQISLLVYHFCANWFWSICEWFVRRMLSSSLDNVFLIEQMFILTFVGCVFRDVDDLFDVINVCVCLQDLNLFYYASLSLVILLL